MQHVSPCKVHHPALLLSATALGRIIRALCCIGMCRSVQIFCFRLIRAEYQLASKTDVSRSRRKWIAVVLHPAMKSRRHPDPSPGPLWIVREVVQFVGVLGKVKELDLVDCRVLDVLPIGVADHSLKRSKVPNDERMNLLLFVEQSWMKTSTVNPLTRTFNASQITECWKQISQVALRCQPLAF